MREHFLMFVWKHKLFMPSALSTADHNEIQIDYSGYWNEDAGPDFKEARIGINGLLWTGHVEIHVKSSDWYRHGHQSDEAYDNVILHVVYENDRPVKRTNGQIIPCIALKGHIPERYMENWLDIESSISWLPCHSHIQEVPDITIKSMMDKTASERLQQKGSEVLFRLNQLSGDWRQVAFEWLAKGLGFKINSDIFNLISQHIPINRILRTIDEQWKLEAVIFGTANLVSGRDDYSKSLLREYDYLKLKFNLTPIQPGTIKFLRTRPSNFPTVRLAQLSAMLFQKQDLMLQILETSSIKNLSELFKAEVTDYWKWHYMFGRKESKERHRSFSTQSLYSLIINVISPLQYAYGQHLGDDSRKMKAFTLLQSLPAEVNKITRKWNDHGIEAEHAMDSQGLIHLHRHYCANKKCLECMIGAMIIKDTARDNAHG